LQLSSIWPTWIIEIRSIQLTVLVIIFVALTAVVALHLTSGLDNSVYLYFRSVQRSANVDAVMITATSFADVSTLLIMAIVLTIIRRTRKMGMIFLTTIVITAILVMYIKPIIGRSGPPYKFEPALRLPKHFIIEDDSLLPSARDFSYPSNHVAITTAFAFIVGFGLNRRSRIAGSIIWVFPIIIAITKLYIMQHYLTDTISGSILGLIVSTILSNMMGLDKPFSMSRFKGKEDIA
jgi:undecaprenyl-diphosphatase